LARPGLHFRRSADGINTGPTLPFTRLSSLIYWRLTRWWRTIIANRAGEMRLIKLWSTKRQHESPVIQL
jgi:hypothetical protein